MFNFKNFFKNISNNIFKRNHKLKNNNDNNDIDYINDEKVMDMLNEELGTNYKSIEEFVNDRTFSLDDIKNAETKAIIARVIDQLL